MRYHPSPKSPKGYRKCNATVRACPYGDEEHIEAANEKELDSIIQQRLTEQYGDQDETLGPPVSQHPTLLYRPRIAGLCCCRRMTT